jgi:hypothetical protein
MTLEEVSSTTKIPQRLLQALERDDYREISGELYIKSFLRAYADAVGLDSHDVVALYEQEHQRASALPDASEDIWQDSSTEVRKIGVAYGRVVRRWPLLLLAVAVVALVLWWLTERGDDQAQSQLSDDSVQVSAPDRADMAGAGTIQESLQTTVMATDSVAVASASGSQPESGRDAPAAAGSDLPPALRGDQRIEFSDGRDRPLVLRLLCREEVPIAVAADRQTDPQVVAWPQTDRPGRLPAARIVAGRPYSVRQGLVVYWGADDHFNVVLSRLDGIELTLNGIALETSAWRPGQEILLDRDSAAAPRDR